MKKDRFIEHENRTQAEIRFSWSDLLNSLCRTFFAPFCLALLPDSKLPRFSAYCSQCCLAGRNFSERFVTILRKLSYGYFSTERLQDCSLKSKTQSLHECSWIQYFWKKCGNPQKFQNGTSVRYERNNTWISWLTERITAGGVMVYSEGLVTIFRKSQLRKFRSIALSWFVIWKA